MLISNKIKIVVLAIALPLIFFTIGYLLWIKEMQYALPTKVPENYVKVKVLEKVGLQEAFGESNGKPFFIHYYNPYCPCSKFNFSYYKSLTDKYKNKFNLFLVIREIDRDIIDELREKIKTEVTLIVDEEGEIAKQTGVYSTPQAVLLNPDYTLYFRGNYNRSIYCTTKGYNYAEMAMDSIIAGAIAPDLGYFAITSYGCSLEREKAFYQVLFSMN